MIIDISPVISESIEVWPGDTPFSLKTVCDFSDEVHYTVAKIESTLHLGAHIDAPKHYHPSGQDIASLPLEPFVGLAQVIEVNVAHAQRIQIEMIKETIRATRVLFKTNTFHDAKHWNTDFAALSKEVIDFLSDHNVQLVGIDTPSVDLFESKLLPSHKALLAHQMFNIEGLELSHVSPGLYQLIALPLNIQTADASPTRAVLMPASSLESSSE